MRIDRAETASNSLPAQNSCGSWSILVSVSSIDNETRSSLPRQYFKRNCFSQNHVFVHQFFFSFLRIKTISHISFSTVNILGYIFGGFDAWPNVTCVMHASFLSDQYVEWSVMALRPAYTDSSFHQSFYMMDTMETVCENVTLQIARRSWLALSFSMEGSYACRYFKIFQ